MLCNLWSREIRSAQRIQYEDRINNWKIAIDDRLFETLALRQPMAAPSVHTSADSKIITGFSRRVRGSSGQLWPSG